MGAFTSLIDAMKEAEYEQKHQFAVYMTEVLSKAADRIEKEDLREMRDFAFAQLDETMVDLSKEEEPKKKDDILNYCLELIPLISLVGAADDATDEELEKILKVSAVLRENRLFENTMAETINNPEAAEQDALKITEMLEGMTDEYSKGKFFAALAGSNGKYPELSADVAKVFCMYTKKELTRFTEEKSPDADFTESIELAADACVSFADDEMVSLLYEIMKKDKSNINFYAVRTLMKLGKDLPEECIRSLAGDLEYAFLTYHAIGKARATEMFPEECLDEVYLAKSDLAHWLCFPTELGKLPDKIEYMGKVKKLFDREVFHVFRFMSWSDTLDEASKGKWLVGWSSNEGGTFSDFSLLEEYEHKTLKGTLRNIRKRILG